VDWVNIGGYVSYSLEPVQKLHDLAHLVEEVYLAAFVVPRPSLVRTALLKLPRVAVYFVKRGIDADGVCRQQQTAYRLSIFTSKSFECVCEYVATIPLVRWDLRLCLGGRCRWTGRQGRVGSAKYSEYPIASPGWRPSQAHLYTRLA
jgi:hypothetical protein